MGNNSSSLKPGTAKEIPQDLIMLNDLLINREIDTPKKTQDILDILFDISAKISEMTTDTVTIYLEYFSRFVDYVMKDPVGIQKTSPKIKMIIADRFEKLEANSRSHSAPKKSQKKREDLKKIFLESIDGKKEIKQRIDRDGVFENIMRHSRNYVDGMAEDFYIKFLLSNVEYAMSVKADKINDYCKKKMFPEDTVMFIYIRDTEQEKTKLYDGNVGWVMIYWSNEKKAWRYVEITNIDVIREMTKSAKLMSKSKDRKIPSEADYFTLVRTVLEQDEQLLFENDVYEKILGHGIKDTSKEYRDLTNQQITDINREGYSKKIDEYHKQHGTDKNKIIFIDSKTETNQPFILMIFWNETEGRWLTFAITNTDTFIKQKFELNESYEPSFTSEQNLEKDKKRYRDNAIKYNNIFQALASGDTEVTLRLLTLDPSIVNKTGSKGNTPLIYVIKNIANMDSINIGLLFETGKIDLDLVDMDGRTALHLAVENQFYFPIIEKLVGSDINLSDRYGFTALDYAATNGNEMYVKLLLILGASPKLNNTIKVSESVKKIVTDVAKESPLHETKGMLNDKTLQHILFELYGFEINNPNINQDVSIAVATKLFKDEFPQLKDHPAFSLPVARSRSVPLPLQESDRLEKKEDKSATAAAMPGGYSPHTWFHHCY
jgi:hypothetical protein